ncbi:unnamed protein product, partial [Rotaria socialis]
GGGICRLSFESLLNDDDETDSLFLVSADAELKYDLVKS